MIPLPAPSVFPSFFLSSDKDEANVLKSLVLSSVQAWCALLEFVDLGEDKISLGLANMPKSYLRLLQI